MWLFFIVRIGKIFSYSIYDSIIFGGVFVKKRVRIVMDVEVWCSGIDLDDSIEGRVLREFMGSKDILKDIAFSHVIDSGCDEVESIDYYNLSDVEEFLDDDLLRKFNDPTEYSRVVNRVDDCIKCEILSTEVDIV